MFSRVEERISLVFYVSLISGLIVSTKDYTRGKDAKWQVRHGDLSHMLWTHLFMLYQFQLNCSTLFQIPKRPC